MSQPTSVFNVAAYIADTFKASSTPLSAMKYAQVTKKTHDPLKTL
jgi:hypothetical protein